MAHPPTQVEENRDLTAKERELVQWLLEHGNANARNFIPQLMQASVRSRCSCGCASIDFAIAGQRPKHFAMRVLSDFQWKDQNQHLFGAFVFEQDGLLAGLDLWSVDGKSTPSKLPPIEALVPFGTPQQA